MAHLALTLFMLFVLALAGVVSGIWLTEVPGISRRIVAFSGGVLIGIAGFWLIPEIAQQSGWEISAVGLIAGFTLVWVIDRVLYPVCSTCTHPHENVAGPLLAAAGVHSFFDGWGIAISQQQGSSDLRLAFLAGIGVHKVPEGLALGVLLLAATRSSLKAGFIAALVQSAMFAGAMAALVLESHLSAHGIATLLAVAAGVFVYLGYHAIEGQSRQRGLATAFMPALTGAAGAALMRLMPGL